MGALAAEGVVIVHFYDLRSAEAAVAEVREQHARQHGGIGFGAPAGSAAAGNWAAPWMWCPQQPGGGRGTIAGHPVWALFAAVSLDDPNQGSLVVLNSDTAIPLLALREIFEPFGMEQQLVIACQPLHSFASAPPRLSLVCENRSKRAAAITIASALLCLNVVKQERQRFPKIVL
ncbi:hypothetical protein B296_00048578 [Ensete ventricosum]|uniref:Uncharacterized protein n=1 Tax=Ensete ventricosum TaxID=4639 RepID=A0A426YU47_ENSVE|nr:hypothetical protein B296_00048578 [Ensete ventricosum]